MIKPLLNNFRLPLAEGTLLDNVSPDKITYIFKAARENDFHNYRPISVLPCFSKMSESVMYERRLNQLTQFDNLT